MPRLHHLACKETVFFMVVELLMNGKTVSYHFSHDLKSLFYVLVFKCTNLESPATLCMLHKLLEFLSLSIAVWFSETSFEGLQESHCWILLPLFQWYQTKCHGTVPCYVSNFFFRLNQLWLFTSPELSVPFRLDEF